MFKIVQFSCLYFYVEIHIDIHRHEFNSIKHHYFVSLTIEEFFQLLISYSITWQENFKKLRFE